MRIKANVGGREVEIELDDRDRDFDQFCIAVWVDGKERSAMWFTDRRSTSPGCEGCGGLTMGPHEGDQWCPVCSPATSPTSKES